ncbi:MAG: hypothetical protein ACFHWX_09150 [Bacteroidota bacterium]
MYENKDPSCENEYFEVFIAKILHIACLPDRLVQDDVRVVIPSSRAM